MEWGAIAGKYREKAGIIFRLVAKHPGLTKMTLRPRHGRVKLNMFGSNIAPAFRELYRLTQFENVFDVSWLRPPQVWRTRLYNALSSMVTTDGRITFSLPLRAPPRTAPMAADDDELSPLYESSSDADEEEAVLHNLGDADTERPDWCPATARAEPLRAALDEDAVGHHIHTVIIHMGTVTWILQ